MEGQELFDMVRSIIRDHLVVDISKQDSGDQLEVTIALRIKGEDKPFSVDYLYLDVPEAQ